MGFVKKGLIMGLGFAALCSGQALAEEEAKPAMDGPPGANSVNINPLGAIFGDYSINYERLFDRQHGLLVEAVYGSSESDDGKSSSFQTGALVGYRWHWAQSQDSGFLGANMGYSLGTAEQKVDNETFDVSVSAFNVTLNGGRRYAWDGGFNVTWRLGVGRAFRDISTTSDDPDAKEAVEKIEEFFDIFPVTFDAELSIGWIF
jgi:hypothetical protein